MFKETNHDLLDRIYVDLRVRAGTRPPPRCTESDGTGETERPYGGRSRQATGSGAVCGDRTGIAGRLADGASALALSAARKEYEGLTHEFIGAAGSRSKGESRRDILGALYSRR